MSDVLVVEDVVKTFDSKTVLNGVSTRIRSREVYGLLEPKGAGKSTLMNIVGGLLKPDKVGF